jgi:hypothetical protein
MKKGTIHSFFKSVVKTESQASSQKVEEEPKPNINFIATSKMEIEDKKFLE